MSGVDGRKLGNILAQLEGSPWAVVAAVSLAAFTAALSSTLIDVVIPEMMAELAIPLERSHWLASGFLLSNTVFLLVAASFINRFGLKATYLLGVAVFAMGAVLGSVTSNESLLILSRIIQGAGSGLLQPIAAVAIARAFPPERFGFAMGIFGAGALMGPTLGPIFGAVLVDSLGWRSTFIAQVPLSAACFLLGELLLSSDSGVPNKRWFDWRGFALLCASVGGLLLTLTTAAKYPLEDPIVPAVCLFTILGFFLFLVQQVGKRKDRLVEVGLFAVPRFAIANAIVFAVGFALYGSLLLIPLFLQSVLGLAATPSGLILLPAGLLMVVLSPLGGHLSDVLAPRLVVTVGMILFSISIAMMAAISPLTSFLEIIIAVCAARMALSCLLPSLYSTALRALPRSALSQASGILNFSRQLGGTIGVATVAVLLHWRVVVNWQVFANGIDRATLQSAFGGMYSFAELFASRDGWVWAQTFAYREMLLATSVAVFFFAAGGLFMGSRATLAKRR